MIPGRVSDCRCRHGSQISTPRHSTSPTLNVRPTSSFEPHAAHDHLPPRLRAAQPDVLEHLGLDQRDRAARPLAVLAVVPVALEPVSRDRGHGVDRAQRVGLADRDRLDLHRPA